MAVSKTTLLLVRHGETEWNRAGRVQGQTDSPLTPTGQMQAAAVARWLSQDPPPISAWKKPPTLIYSSDLGRTQATAAPIADELEMVPTISDQLREMNFGQLEGLTYKEVEVQFPEITQSLWGDNGDPNHPIPGGESRSSMTHRITTALTRITVTHPGETIVVVTHGGAIGYFLRRVMQIPLNIRSPFKTANGSVAVVSHDGERFKVRALGLVPFVS